MEVKTFFNYFRKFCDYTYKKYKEPVCQNCEICKWCRDFRYLSDSEVEELASILEEWRAEHQ